MSNKGYGSLSCSCTLDKEDWKKYINHMRQSLSSVDISIFH